MGVDRENDWFIDNVLTLTTDLICQEVNGLLDLSEVSELLVWHLIKLGPWLDLITDVIQSKLEWTSSDDTISPGEEVETDDGLEDGGLTCRLSSQHCNFW